MHSRSIRKRTINNPLFILKSMMFMQKHLLSCILFVCLTSFGQFVSAQTPTRSQANRNKGKYALVARVSPVFSDEGSLAANDDNRVGQRISFEFGNSTVGENGITFQYQLGCSGLSFTSANELTLKHGSGLLINPNVGLKVANHGKKQDIVYFSLAMSAGLMMGVDQFESVFVGSSNGLGLSPSMALSISPTLTVKLTGSNFISVSYDLLYLGNIPTSAASFTNGLFVAPTLSYNFQ